MWELLSLWWYVVFIVALQFLLQGAFSTGYKLFKARLDRALPDDLPMTTAQWVAAQLRRLGLQGELRAVVHPAAERYADAFWPSRRLILLSKETWFKNDPSFWAIGAHELGHALVYRRAVVVAGFFQASRAFTNVFAAAGSTFILFNILYGEPLITEIAYVLFIAGLAFNVGVLIDEAAASTLAMRMLREDGQLDRRQLRGARLALLAAFGTYLGGFVGRVVVLLQYGVLARMIESRAAFEAAPPLTGWRLVLVTALAGYLVVHALWLAVNALRRLERDAYLRLKMTQLLFEVALVVVLFLVWDQSAAPAFAIAVMFAVLAARNVAGLFILPLYLVLFLAFIPLVLVASRLAPLVTSLQEGEESEAYARAVEAGDADLEAAKEVVLEAMTEESSAASWAERVRLVMPLCALPLLGLLLV